jgi:hypothetical protein
MYHLCVVVKQVNWFITRASLPSLYSVAIQRTAMKIRMEVATRKLDVHPEFYIRTLILGVVMGDCTCTCFGDDRWV